MLSLNEIISCFLMQSNTITQDEANAYLIDLSNEEDFYLNCLNIFYSEESTISTKFFAIQVLKNTIQKRWICMRPSFQDDVRSFILFYFFENPFHKESPIDILVFQIIFAIIFFEWPSDWPSFFDDLFNIENSEITIILSLKLISFIGYEAQGNNITSVGAFTISSALENQIPNIFLFIRNLLFKNTVSKEIANASFTFLTVCIPWIPANLFVESLFFSQLAENFFENSELAESIIPFLTELVTSLDLPPDKQGIISQIFNLLMNIYGKITNVLPFVSAIKTCYDFYAQVVEMPDNVAQYKEALDIIMRITIETDDLENPELLETCLSFLVEICQRLAIDNSPATGNLYLPLTYPILEILHAKIPPPYFIVTHIDELDIEHSTMENSQYHSNIYSYIKQSLTFLINLNENSVIDFFYEKFGEFQNSCEKEGLDETNSNEDGNFDEINYNISKLIWMLYSSAGTFSEATEEDRLFDLFDLLVEFTKDLCPYIMINTIMAVFQYPHFMQKFPEKLNFLTQKIFELLVNYPRETEYPAAYILKTCSTIIRQLIIQQDLFNYLISLSDTLKEKLCNDCLIDIYSVFGIFLKEISDNKQKEDILPMILQLPSIQTASDISLNREFLLCLKCHIALQNKIAFDYFDFLKETNLAQLFQIYSNELFQQFQSREKNQDLMNSIYLIKSSIINLITQFVTFCLEPTFVNDFIVPSFLNIFLADYNESPNELKAFHTIKFAQAILQRSDVPVSIIYDSILRTTFSMISQNFDDFTEFRLPFFTFISSIIHHNFTFLMEMKISDLDEFIQILMFGSNHQLSSISQLCLNLLSDFVTSLKGQSRFEEIFSQYCVELIKNTFSILSDLSMKSDFDEIAGLIKSIFSFQDEIARFGPVIVEELVSILPMANPSDLIELVKSLTECGPYLEGIRILLKDFVIGLGKVFALERETFPIDEENLSALIRESFTDNQGEFTDELVTEDHFSEEIRSAPFNNH